MDLNVNSISLGCWIKIIGNLIVRFMLLDSLRSSLATLSLYAAIRKNQSSLLSMEELFRYYLENIIILRIGTGLRYLWLRFVRHRKISYRTLYEGSKSKKATELSNFDNEMSNRAWGCGFIFFVIFLIMFLRRFL